MFKINFIVAFILPILATAQSVQPTEQYQSSQDLSQNLKLYWNHDDTVITLELHYTNAKWVLFGLKSPTFSDVILSWVNSDGIGHFSDRNLLPNNSMVHDSDLNWIPLDSFSQNNSTVLKFKRDIKVDCGNETRNEDLDIVTGPMTIVFALGDQIDYIGESVLLNTVQESQVELLSQTNGPFGCPVKPVEPVLDSRPTANYQYDLELIKGLYKIYWNYTDSDVTVELHCKTNGWVGFGFSPNGGMDGSDVAIGWVSNGQVNFTDRHIVGRQVLVDKNQDWKLLYFSESNGINVFKFTRMIKLCDSDDLTIQQGSPYIIFAYGNQDPLPGQDISYHGMNRGGKVVSFISSPPVKDSFEPDDMEILDATISHVILPKKDTFYICKGFQVPKEFTQKRHIYKWELILPKMNVERMHHTLIYECKQDFNISQGSVPGDCDKDENKMKNCQSIAFGWAYGGQNIEIYPKDMGYPIGGDTDYSSYIYEIHYDNPQQVLGYIEKITWRYYMTKSLRPKELGIYTLGTGSSPLSIAIPPGVERFPIKTYCFNECVKDLNKENITIVSAIPHTHLVGVEVWTKIIRKGKDIGYLFFNENYDFNYQTSYTLNPYVNITSDDELITQCVYKTTDNNEFVLGGPSTRQEMCFHFLTYYPRKPNFKECISVPYFDDYAMLLVKLNQSGNAQVPNFGDSLETFNQAVEQTFETIQSNDYVRRAFLEFYNSTRMSNFCAGEFFGPKNQTKAMNTYSEPDLCNVLPNEEQNGIFQFINMIFNWILTSVLQWFQSIF